MANGKKWSKAQRSKYTATVRQRQHKIIDAVPVAEKLTKNEKFLNDCWDSLDVERKARALVSLLVVENDGSLKWR
jgi:hypothetical protein